MFKWSAFPFIRVAVCLIAGILLFEAFPGVWENAPVVLSALLGVTLICWIFLKHHLIYGLCCLSMLVYAGGLLTLLKDGSLRPEHYLHSGQPDAFIGRIVSDQVEKNDYTRYEMEVLRGRTDTLETNLTGLIYLYVRKTGNELIRYGDVVLVSKGYFPISGPGNPHEFDYKKYLSRQSIHAHAFVSPQDLRVIGHSIPNRLMEVAITIRKHSSELLDEFIRYDREKAILSALLLGIKDNLDHEVKSAYTAAGAMHVLAVSGLHVGIVYYMLLLLLKPIKERRWGNIPFVLVSLSVIWLYALVTGFTPSVMRAVTMFSVIIISDGFNRKANIYNSLGVAACILIAFDPFIIYSVGFQLSFAAVFGIVMLYPRLYRILEFDGKVADYCWSITCVSIAAQAATFPLSVLYFHQFPTYSLLSNLLVIPSATVMLITGMIMLLSGSVFPIIGEAIGFVFSDAVWLLNEGVDLVRRLPHPVIDRLTLDVPEVLLIYLAMIGLYSGFSRFRYDHVFLGACMLLMFFGWGHYKLFRVNSQKKVMFYQLDDVLAIDLVHGRSAELLIDATTPAAIERIKFQVEPNRLAGGLPEALETISIMNASNHVCPHDLIDLVYWQGVRFALVKDLKSSRITRPVYAEVVCLLEDQDTLNFPVIAPQVILGTGLDYYATEKWLHYFSDREIKVHSLSRDGFWELDLNKTQVQRNESYRVFRTE